MDDLPGTFVRQHERLNEIARVLRRYGFARLADHGHGIAQVASAVLRTPVDDEVVQMSSGERLRRALTELGTTWIKFGQMLSLRPDLVGLDVAGELGRLQADVPGDAPGVARALVETELGASVGELFGEFDPEPFASGSVAQVHRGALVDGTESRSRSSTTGLIARFLTISS